MSGLINTANQIKISFKLLAIYLVLLLMTFSLFSIFAPRASAATLPDSELQALNNYPNWVAPVCSGGTSASSSSSGTGGEIYILGDSITVRAVAAYQTALKTAFSSVVVDGLSARSLNGTASASTDGTDPSNHNHDTGMKAIKDDQAEINKASVVVIALGTNGGDTAASIKAALQAIRSETSSPNVPIYWVDTFGLAGTNFGRSGMSVANQAIYGNSSSGSTQNYQVVGWAKTVDKTINPQHAGNGGSDPNKYIDNGDGLGVHPTSAGTTALAKAVLSSVSNGASAQASSLSSNGVTPACCDTSGGSAGSITLTGSDRISQALNFFVKTEGLSAAQAVGIVANLYNESSVDPTSGSPIRNGVGFGIAQWTFSARQDPLVAYAASLKLPVTDLSVQLQFLWHELSTDYKGTLAGLHHITGNDAGAAGQAAVVFRDGFEACDMSYTSCSDRQSVGVAMFQKYGASLGGGSGGGTSSVGGSSSTGCSTSSTTAVTGQYTNPFPGGWTPNRLDMGYDGTFKGHIVAPFAGTITYAAKSFSNWGGYIEIKADKKPAGITTSTLYFAEGVKPAVVNGVAIHAGQHVNVGDPIGDPAPSPYGNAYGTTANGSGQIEWGVAVDGKVGTPTNPIAESGISNPAQAVLAFAQWAEQTLQLPAPSQTGNAGFP